MKRVLKEASLEEWIEFAFARRVTQPAWFWENDADRWEGTPERTAELLAETFERCDELLEPFDDEQVAQGLQFLLAATAPDISAATFAGTLHPDVVERVWEAMVPLFREGFAIRCSNHLSHLEPADANPLNGVCYQWWTAFVIEPGPEESPDTNRADLVLGVLERILDLPSDACRESALRGLARWEAVHSERVHQAIDRFIWANRDLRLPLRTYAYAARHGDVP